MNDFHCAAPWRSLHINPQGDVRTCCAGEPNMLGNLNDHTIQEILNSDVMIEIRQSLSQGRPHRYCSNCVRAERFGADSERRWHNDVNPGFDYATAGDRYHYPVNVDVRWNTTCNLSCNYCHEACSSKWAGIKNIPFKSGARPYYEQVCDFIEQHREHIHEVALVGGEPLLLPENNRLLDVIPQDCIVTLITNLSVNLENNKIFQRLVQRSRVGWSMSFDNIGPRFEYVRHGSDWNLLQHNLDIVQRLFVDQGHWGEVHAVYNVYNSTRLCEFREFVQRRGLSVVWANLFQPRYLDPFLHGRHVAEPSAQEIQRFYAMDMATHAEKTFFDQALRTFDTVIDAHDQINLEFRRHIHAIEDIYHTDHKGQFEKLWPELASLC